jgi:hypothetical protein
MVFVSAIESECAPAVLRSLTGLCPPLAETENDADAMGRLLVLAVTSCDVETVAEIVSLPSAHVNMPLLDGTGTVMHLAAERGNVQVIELLLQVGASSRARDSSGCKPLDRARTRGRERASALLLAWTRANQSLAALALGAAPILSTANTGAKTASGKTSSGKTGSGAEDESSEELVRALCALGPRVRNLLVPWLEASIIESGEEIPNRGFNVM